MAQNSVSRAMMMRLPDYLAYLKALPADGQTHISATSLARALHMGEVQVRKDLAMVSDGGRPKTGYPLDVLIADLESFLGYANPNDAVLIGTGRLGRALLSYDGFAAYGLNIVAGFDADESLLGRTRGGKPILPMAELAGFCAERRIKIGVITVPAAAAQSVCDQLIGAGIEAVWNFAPTHLSVPPEILVQSENMAASLALLSMHLSEHRSGRE